MVSVRVSPATITTGARDIDHIGSAHGDAELELLKTAARRGASRADGRRIRSPATIAERHGLS